MVLVRPAAGGVEQEGLARLSRGLEALVVEPVVDHSHRCRLEPEQLDRACADEGARADDERSRARRAMVGERPEGAFAAREELRQVEVLEVVEGNEARNGERGDTDRERIVDDLGAGERAAERCGTGGGERHRDQALGHASRRAVGVDDLGR